MSDHLILQRWADHPLHGTLGELFYKEEKIADTIEKPWLNNKPFVSCVPHGTYELVPFTRQNGDHVYALYNPDLDVYVDEDERPEDSGRYSILIHIANWSEELMGCIAPGLSLGIGRYKNNSQKPEVLMVYKSASACKKLFDLVKKNQIEYITILKAGTENDRIIALQRL